MDGDGHHRAAGFKGLLDWIEANLDSPLTVEQIARVAGLSPYHFSRLFTARMGRSAMAHVRHMRLTRAARRLAAEPGLRLVDLAFDSGFESQEAFTRAFNRTFGASPGRLRRAYRSPTVETSMTAPPFKPARVEQQHELVRREAFSVAGLSRRFGEGAKLAIPGLWQRLIEMMPFDGQSGPETYGVVTSVNREDGSFRYMAAGRLNPAAETPKGLERKDIPANTYVVFRITMAGGPVHPQIKAVMQTVWGELIPASGLNAIDAPDFELYSGGLPPDQAGAVIDYHVPVRA